MPSTGGDASVVTAHDWILGIAFSILASIIGGASKLSIRKSWIIDAKRTKGISYEEVNIPVNYNENSSFDREHHDNHDIHGFDNETHLITPLEVGSTSSPPSLSIHSLESLSSQDGNETEQYHGSLDNRNIKFHTKNGLAVFSAKQISWGLYLSGMVGMSFLNPLCCVLAMKYANPSILAPFSGLTLVWVVLFSSVVLDEHPKISQKVACALIVLGEVLVAMFGDHTNGEEKDVEDVLSSYHEPGFRTFCIIMTLCLVQLGIFVRICPKTSLLRKVAWGSIGGSITGFQNFLKDTLTIYHAATKQSQDSLSSDGSGATSLPAVLFVFMAMASLTAFVGLLFLAACMKRYDATYSAAMFVVSFVLSASLMSSVHYHTFEHLSGVLNYIMYPLGLVTLFLGAFLLVNPTAFSVWGFGDCLSENATRRVDEEEDEPSRSEANASSTKSDCRGMVS